MQALTCASGQVLGDFIAQAASTGGFATIGFDWHRSLVLSSFAALIGGAQQSSCLGANALSVLRKLAGRALAIPLSAHAVC